MQLNYEWSESSFATVSSRAPHESNHPLMKVLQFFCEVSRLFLLVVWSEVILLFCERLAMMFIVLAGNSISGSFFNRGAYGNVWSSSESGANAWYRNVNSGSAQVNRNANDKSNGLSVRCL